MIRSITNRGGNTQTQKGFLIKMQRKVIVRALDSQEVKIVQNPPDPDSKFLQQSQIHSAFFPLLAMVDSKEFPQRKVTTPKTTRYFTVWNMLSCSQNIA